MPKQSSFSAVDSLTGYLYQVRYALLDALRRAKDDVRFSVSIETLDDIVFESDGQPVELLQAKHHSKPANLTDTSTDLWKTIRIWVGQYKTRINSRYYLVTTATAKDGSALCDYNDETLVTNSLVCRAQEKRHVSRISRQAR